MKWRLPILAAAVPHGAAVRRGGAVRGGLAGSGAVRDGGVPGAAVPGGAVPGGAVPGGAVPGGPTPAADDGLSGAGGTAPAPDRRETPPTGRNGERGAGPARLKAWAELLRVSALFSVPGDALAGAAAVGRRPGRGTALAVGASLCLYEAGMALNDWADREEDAVDRPHRPIPSGRISPAAALGAAGVLTAAGLALAARAGRPALAVATGLAATVWAYDLHLKHTKAGPAAMAAARSLDLLLGATAAATGPAGATRAARVTGTSRATGTGPAAAAGPAGATRAAGVTGTGPAGAAGTSGASAPAGPPHTRSDNVAGRPRPVGAALPAALILGAHTYGVTAVSRHETQGGSTGVPLAVLATTAALGAAVVGEHRGRIPGRSGPDLPLIAFTAAYLRTAGPPLLHAALNPSPPLIQRAVGGGIRAMIPLQAALAARAGAPATGLAVMGLVPLARALARKVSPT